MSAIEEDMLETIKREWQKGTPERKISRMARISRGELLRIVPSLGLPLDRAVKEIKEEEKTQRSHVQSPRPVRPPQIRHESLLTLSKLERIKDLVRRFRGDLAVIAYLPASRDYYRIECSPTQDKAIYAKYTSCEGDQRETVEEFWPSRMYDIFNTTGVAIRVQFKGHDAKWFDTSDDRAALRRMLGYVLKLERNRSL
jgi:hypothetical protein